MPLLKKYKEDTSGYYDMVRRPAAYLETVTVVIVLAESKGKVVHLHAVKA
jgi:phosphopantetheine adenylyltransferase